MLAPGGLKLEPGEARGLGRGGPRLLGLRIPGRGGDWEFGPASSSKGTAAAERVARRQIAQTHPPTLEKPIPPCVSLTSCLTADPESHAFSLTPWKHLPPSLSRPSQHCQLNLIPWVLLSPRRRGKRTPACVFIPSESAC